MRDLTGERFGRLLVISRAEDAVTISSGKKRTRRRWLCKCDCGNTKVVYHDNLLGDKTHSCGCIQKEAASRSNTTHGETDTRLYGVWCAMKRRCYNPDVPEYKNYGGRGITMCDDWKNSYELFRDWALSTGYDCNAGRGKCTIDRIDNNSGYCPENCRWVDQQAQMNNVRYNRHITYNNETHTIAEWSRITGIPYSVLRQRISRYGYDIGQAIQKEYKHNHP